jgi:hypothetical protein
MPLLLAVILLNVILLNVILLNVILLNVILLNVILLMVHPMNIILFNVIKLIVILLNVVAQYPPPHCQKGWRISFFLNRLILFFHPKKLFFGATTFNKTAGRMTFNSIMINVWFCLVLQLICRSVKCHSGEYSSPGCADYAKCYSGECHSDVWHSVDDFSD